METVTLVVQVLLWFICPTIIGLILLQGGAGDISSAFGGGGMLDSTLGVGASRKMGKITAWLAGILFVAILFLAIPHKGSFGKAAAGGDGASAASVPAAMAPVPGTAPQAAPAPAVAPVAIEQASASAPAAVPVPLAGASAAAAQ